MENFLIRARETSAISQQTRSGAKATSASGGFQASFKEFMQKVGSNVGGGINVAVNNSAIGKIEERSDQALNRSEPDYGRGSDQDYDRSGSYERQAARSDNADSGNSYDDNPPAERRDDQGRDNVSERGNNVKDEGYGEERAARAEDTPDRPENNARSGKQEDDSRGAADSPSKNDQTTKDKGDNEGPAKEQEPADKNEISSKKAATSGSEDAATVNPAVVTNVVVAVNDAGNILASAKKQSLAKPLTKDDRGNVAGQVPGRDIPKANIKGKAKAKSQGTKTGNNVAANVGAKPNGKAQTSVKAVNSSLNDKAIAKADVDPDFKSKLAQQAAGISKAIGKGGRVEVSVNVAREADTIVSKPPSTLVSQLATGDKNNKSSSGNGKPSAQAAKNAANQNLQQAKGGTAQGLDQQTKSQVSKFQSEVGDQGKAPTQTAAKAGITSQPVTAGGGEAQPVASLGGVAEPGQTRQSAAAKAAAPRQASLARQPVVDQVSVQITKAIAAGVDKINIQLKPNSLGRIEVNIEVAKNGHVSAVVIADNKNTLDLLQNGSDELKQALQNAGLDTDSGSLNFGLREESHMADGGNGGAGSSVGDSGYGGGEDDPEADLSAAAHDVNIITDNRVDVRA